MRRTIFLFCTALLLSATIACQAKNADRIAGTWHLVEMNGQTVDYPAEQFSMTLDADGTLHGALYANDMGGRYTVSGCRRIKMDNAYTKMARVPSNVAPEQFEQPFIDAMSRVLRFDAGKDRLVLKGKNTRMVFKRLK